MSAGSTMVVEYPAGAVNTMYNEITFSSMIHLDPAIVPKRKNAKLSVAKEVVMGRLLTIVGRSLTTVSSWSIQDENLVQVSSCATAFSMALCP